MQPWREAPLQKPILITICPNRSETDHKGGALVLTMEPCGAWFSPLRLCAEKIHPLSEMGKLMEPISIIGNALHIYMLAFNEPNSIRSSELMAFRKVIELSGPGGEYISDCCQGGGGVAGVGYAPYLLAWRSEIWRL